MSDLTWEFLHERCAANAAPQALEATRQAAIAGDGSAYLAAMETMLARQPELLALDLCPVELPLPGGSALTLWAMAPWHPLAMEAAGSGQPLGRGDLFALGAQTECIWCDGFANGWSIWQPTRLHGWPVAAMARRLLGEAPRSRQLPRPLVDGRRPTLQLIVPGGCTSWLDAWEPPLRLRAFVAGKLVEAEQVALARAIGRLGWSDDPRRPDAECHWQVQDLETWRRTAPPADLTVVAGLSVPRLSLLPTSQPVGWTHYRQRGKWESCFRPVLAELPIRRWVNRHSAALLSGCETELPLGLKAVVPGPALALMTLAEQAGGAVQVVDPWLPQPSVQEPVRKAATLYRRPHPSSVPKAAERRAGYDPDTRS